MATPRLTSPVWTYLMMQMRTSISTHSRRLSIAFGLTAAASDVAVPWLVGGAVLTTRKSCE